MLKNINDYVGLTDHCHISANFVSPYNEECTHITQHVLRLLCWIRRNTISYKPSVSTSGILVANDYK